MKYNIISFNMSRYSDWTESGVVNRNYHILHTLAKDERVNKIIAVDFMPFNFKRALKVFWLDHIKKGRRGEVIYGDLTTQSWRISPKINVMSTIDSVFNKKRIIKELKRLIEIEGMHKNLIVWNFNPHYTDYLGKLNQRLNIFDAVDNWSTHSSYKKFKKRLEKNYKKLTEDSNLVYTVSEDLTEFLPSDHTHWLPNAVDFDHFQTTETLEEVEKLKKPILGFLGVLQDRIDIDLIKKIANDHKDKSIVLAGPVWKGFPKEELDKFENIHFTGAVAYWDIPKYYNSFDVGLIMYKRNDFIKSTNSMKYYEYLAAGLPVVSSWSGGIEKFEEVMYIAQDNEDFSKLIDAALAEHSAEDIEKRKEFVKNMTWKSRINSIFDHISQLNQDS